MKNTSKRRNKFQSYLYNHLWLKFAFDYGGAFLASVASAAIFSFGIVCFLNPVVNGDPTMELVSGGSSGLAQVIASILRICGVRIESGNNLIFSIAYLCVNIPLIILAFFGIGKRFGAFTLVNVLCVFLFSNLFEGKQFFIELATLINNHGGFFARVFFAGLCTGLSSAIAFKIDSSAGGFDILTYYLSLRKSTTVGKYGVLINSGIIFTFYLLSGISPQIVPFSAQYSSWAIAVAGIFFSVVYLFTVMLVVDAINVRNKKVQIEVNTTNSDLPRLLIARVPHGATVVNAKGAYSGQDRIIIYMIVSSLELKATINLIQEVDPQAFVSVKPLYQVYGRFFSQKVR